MVACAQDQAKPASPALKATGKSGAANITITYGSPSVKGRKVWGELVPYGKVWRTGANDATVIDVDADVKVEGQTLAKGFAITRGSQGSVVFDGEKLLEIPTTPVQAIDTVGAGDMYAGAFLYALTHGLGYEKAGKLASITAAKIVTCYGPRLETAELQALLGQI
jgi:hypothetical protein